jgi:hypothetical protein
MKPAAISTIRQTIAEKPNVRASTTALLISNAIPLFGVLVLHWDIFTIMFLFWFENVIIGVFNVLKMITSAGSLGVQVGKLFSIPFFCIHYGIFTMVHGVLIFAIFGGVAGADRIVGVSPFAALVGPTVHRLLLPVVVIILSHALSFCVNYIGQGEYRKYSPQELMAAPYGRIIVLHLTVLLGAFAAVAIGAPWPAVALLVLLKTVIDLAAHVAERKRAEAR